MGIIDWLKGDVINKRGEVVGYIEKDNSHQATVRDLYGREVNKIDCYGDTIEVRDLYGRVTERGKYDEYSCEVNIYDGISGVHTKNVSLDGNRITSAYDNVTFEEKETFGLAYSYSGENSLGEEKVQSSRSSNYTSSSNEYYMEENRCIDETSSWIYDDDEEDDEFDYIY